MKSSPRFLRRAGTPIDAFAVFLFTALLIRPLFKAKYLAYWGSIESTFIAQTRYLIEHWPHPDWQPLWYAGTRFDYIYPPGVPYGAALISMAFGCWPVKAYHIYTAFLYCVGAAGVYFLIRTGTQSRAAAWLGSAASVLISPSFLFMKNLRADSWMHAPQRLHVLLMYGEGPHIAALSLLPFAIAFAWRALQRRSRIDVVLAAICSAAVVSHNFYGAVALAIFYCTLVWSLWVTKRDRGLWIHAAAIPALAYGLTAFWLTPSYIRITAENMKYVSGEGGPWPIWIVLAFAGLFLFLSFKLGRGHPERVWPIFVSGLVAFFSFDVLGNHIWKFQLLGQAPRFVPELDLSFILGCLVVLGWLYNRPGYVPKIAAAVIVIAAFATSLGYVHQAWGMFPLSPNYEARPEYKIPEWVAANLPDARVNATGSVAFWYDVWHDLPQVGGGSDQGILNGMPADSRWELRLGENPEVSILWLQALGADAIYVSDQRSQEVYKELAHPAKLAGVLQSIYDDGQGNVIYQVPRRYRSRVRVVDTLRIKAAKPPRPTNDLERLRPYVDMIEHGPDSPATITRLTPEEMRVEATLSPEQSILVQESYDPAWRAWSAGRRLAVSKDAMGFMLIDAPPGQHDITLRFVTPLENQVGRGVTLFSILSILALTIRRGIGAVR